MKKFWDERYAEEAYVYGEKPNAFFKEQLDALNPGKILLPADGEGRNGVYAAEEGWEVSAFDISHTGKEKADQLAEKKGVQINYKVGSLEDQYYEAESFDVIALIFAHFPPHLKQDYHQQFVDLLKPGGILIFEAFSKDHLAYSAKNPKVGGPKNRDILYDTDELENYFSTLEKHTLIQTEVELSEGAYHQGTGSAVRFVGVK